MSLQLDEVAQVVAKGYLKAGVMGELPSGNEPGKLQGNSLDTKLLSEPVAR